MKKDIQRGIMNRLADGATLLQEGGSPADHSHVSRTTPFQTKAKEITSDPPYQAEAMDKAREKRKNGCVWEPPVVLLTCSLSNAQDAAKQSGQGASSARQQKAARKVWTDDDMGSVRRRGDVNVAAAQNPTVPAGGEAAPAPTPAATSSSTAHAGTAEATGKKALSNPKTAEEADNMIAWEQRDIDSQQQYVDQVQQQLDQAPADQKAHLQKILAERQQILADVRREQQDLIGQKKALQKKSGDTSVAASTQP